MLLPVEFLVWVENGRDVYIIRTSRKMRQVVKLYRSQHCSGENRIVIHTPMVNRAVLLHEEVGAAAVLEVLEVFMNGAVEALPLVVVPTGCGT